MKYVLLTENGGYLNMYRTYSEAIEERDRMISRGWKVKVVPIEKTIFCEGILSQNI